MTKTMLYTILIISTILMFISFIGMLGTGLDEKHMIYSGVSTEEVDSFEHKKIKFKGFMFLLLGVVSILGVVYSSFKLIK